MKNIIFDHLFNFKLINILICILYNYYFLINSYEFEHKMLFLFHNIPSFKNLLTYLKSCLRNIEVKLQQHTLCLNTFNC